MRIKTRISFKQYLKLLFGLTYRKPLLICLLFVALLLLLWILFYHSGILSLPKPLIYQYLTLILITIVQPLVIYRTIWRNYYSSNHLREQLEVEFSDEKINISGESFYMEIAWDKMFRIVEHTNWFLFYQNNLSAIIVPKKDLGENGKVELKRILKNVRNEKVELK